MEITKETTMGAMLEYDMGIAYVLMQAGMHCVGCPSSIGESLEEACAVHGLDVDVVLASIQEYLKGQGRNAQDRDDGVHRPYQSIWEGIA